jgi:hypothetical protein
MVRKRAAVGFGGSHHDIAVTEQQRDGVATYDINRVLKCRLEYRGLAGVVRPDKHPITGSKFV